MNNERRSCAWCSKAFAGPLATRSDKKYCNAVCRQAAWRDDRLARARDVRAVLARRDDDLNVERGPAASAAIASGAADAFVQGVQDRFDGVPAYERRLDALRAEMPDAEPWFGRAALVAAATALPAGACRWCSAARFAQVHALPQPNLGDAATREMFGNAPCSECRKRVRHEALVASGALRRTAHDGAAMTCYRCSAAESVQRALVAGATVPRGDVDVLTAAQLPHTPLPLATPATCYSGAPGRGPCTCPRCVTVGRRRS